MSATMSREELAHLAQRLVEDWLAEHSMPSSADELVKIGARLLEEALGAPLPVDLVTGWIGAWLKEHGIPGTIGEAVDLALVLLQSALGVEFEMRVEAGKLVHEDTRPPA